MDKGNVLNENELKDVNGGGISDYIKEIAKRKASYTCEICAQIYENTELVEANQYATLGKHLCPTCKKALSD